MISSWFGACIGKLVYNHPGTIQQKLHQNVRFRMGCLIPGRLRHRLLVILRFSFCLLVLQIFQNAVDAGLGALLSHRAQCQDLPDSLSFRRIFGHSDAHAVHEVHQGAHSRFQDAPFLHQPSKQGKLSGSSPQQQVAATLRFEGLFGHMDSVIENFHLG